MHLIVELTAFVFQRIADFVLTQKAIADIASLLAVLSLCFISLYAKRRSAAGLFTKNLATDLLYSAVYLSGAYSIFVGLPIFRALKHLMGHYAPYLQTHALDAMPWLLQFMITIVVADLAYYTWHRTVHATPFLWAFHSIHHSQERLTVATSYRFHVFEEAVRGFFYFVPAAILNMPTHVWLPLDVTVNWLLLLQHSDLDWTYGVFGRIFVSPQYHRVHHSIDRDDVDTNFATFLSFWDVIFGTANRRATRPASYGAPNMAVPESFFRQIFFPLFWLAHQYNPRLVRRPASDVSLAGTDS